ncbi:MAG: polysaccharide deacetylase family protein [Clostridia bacterium]|nr:polysaccharide deacetylase family protein [Clostridia bacterium]
MNIFKCKHTPLICKTLCAVLAALIIFLVWYICSTNNSLNALDKRIDKLTSQSAKTEKELNAKLKEANATIKDNEAQLKEYRDLINRLKAENAEQAALIGELQTPLNGRDEKTAEPADTKIAYLTFDDGPSEHTEEILKILSERGAVGTFFVINNKYLDKAAAIHKQGSALAMHSATHDYKTIYSSVDAYFADLYMIEARIYEVTGIKPKIMRLPGGSSNTVSKDYATGVVTQIVERLNAEGYIYFDWNVDSTDASAASVPALTLLEKVKSACVDKPVINVLMHDTDQKKTTVEALPLIIDYLRSEGYQFMTLSPTSTLIQHSVNN